MGEEEKKENFMEKTKHELEDIEHKAEDVVKPFADKIHAKPWMILAGIAAVIVVLLAVGGWCAWRFLKKKRPKGADENLEDDEKDLVGNEEEQAEEVEEVKGNEDFKGKIHYKLEYDFTTQELKVTVIECSDLPPTDWSTGLTDPFVKVYLLPDKKPKYETKVHRKNLNPKFDQTFIFKNLPYVDPFVKLKLFDSKGKRIGKKKKTSVKSCNLNL